MALINLRNALMTGKRLPYDAELEYLESTGTQWIDTAVDASLCNSAIMKIECAFSVTGGGPDNNYNGVFGAAAPRFGVYTINNNLSWGYGQAHDNVKTFTYGDWIESTCVFTKGNQTTTFDDSSFTATSSTILTSRTIGVFCRNYTPVQWVALAKIRYLRIYVDSTLVRDFIPVRKGTVGYLYDRVSGKLFGNAGTGDFVLGPDVVPVEWLGFGGAQYFSTGVYATENTRIKARLKTISTGNKNWFGGSLTGTATNASGFVFNAFSSNSIEYLFGNGGWKVVSSTGIVGKVFDLDFGKDAVRIDGTTISTPSYTAFDTQSAAISLGVRYGGSAYITGQAYWSDIYEGQTAVRKFRPIRVGTDATSWEGAMMDVLTRRIYRNAGTGAFGYGNDLKYPIPAE